MRTIAYRLRTSCRSRAPNSLVARENDVEYVPITVELALRVMRL